MGAQASNAWELIVGTSTHLGTSRPRLPIADGQDLLERRGVRAGNKGEDTARVEVEISLERESRKIRNGKLRVAQFGT